MAYRSKWRLLLVLAGSCSFSPQSLSPGEDASSQIDSSIPIIDGPMVDGPIIDGAVADGPIIDASLPDAPPDLCTGGSAALALSTSFSAFSAPAGNDYQPVCASALGDINDTFFHVDLAPAAAGMDFVVDIDDNNTGTTEDWDSILDLSADCAASLGAGTCADANTFAKGEVVVQTNAVAGRQYVIVDTFDNTQPGDAFAYQLRAFLRPVRSAVAAETTCDPFLINSRCDNTSYCLAVGNGTPACLTVTAVPEIENNDDCDEATPVMTPLGDVVYTGSMEGGADADWFKLPAGNNTAYNFRAVLYGPNGGCPADFSLRFRGGNNCSTDVDIDNNDNSGLGACPVLVRNNVTDATNVLVVERPSNTNGNIAYTLVVDIL